MKKGFSRSCFVLLLFLLLCAVGRPAAAASGDVPLTLNTPKVKTVRAGFHPGKGNALPILVSLNVKGTYNDSSYTCKCRLKILNAKNQVVFQKGFKIPSGNVGTLLLFYQWNGKAASGNEAKLPAGKYVPNGKYKVEAELYATGSGSSAFPTKRKRTGFTVSGKALGGAKALSIARGTPLVYTGYSDIDYIAELMVKAAGVTPNMSDNTKVQKIYHYMTQNFKHIKAWDYGGNYKVYYNVDKLKGKISQYEDTVFRKWKKGEVIFDNSLAGYMIGWTMPRRVGVCDDNAELFKILLAHVGVQAGLCHGYYLNRSGSKAGHTWNWVLVDGTMYYYDVDVEIINYGKGQGDYYWYKESLAASQKRHEYSSSEKKTTVKIPQWQGW